MTLPVSSGDYTVSSGDSGDFFITVQAAAPGTDEVFTLWNKPIDSYTVTEGLLFIIMLLLLLRLFLSLGGARLWPR